METIKKYGTIFLGILAAIFGVLFVFYKRKSDVNEVVNNNTEVERKALTVESDNAILKGKQEAESEKRNFLEKEIAKESSRNEDIDTVINFFNSRNKPK